LLKLSPSFIFFIKLVKQLELELSWELQNSKQLSAKLAKVTSTNEYTEKASKYKLYSDLTNLLIQSVKVKSLDEHTLTCLQVGKKGGKYKSLFKQNYQLIT